MILPTRIICVRVKGHWSALGWNFEDNKLHYGLGKKDSKLDNSKSHAQQNHKFYNGMSTRIHDINIHAVQSLSHGVYFSRN